MKKIFFYTGGLSLLEIMISICLLATILLSIVTIFPSGIEGIKTGKNISIACNIANKHLELYKSDFYMVPNIMGTELTSSDWSSIDSAVNMEGTVFTPYVTVNQIHMGAGIADPNEAVSVTVRVSWKQSTGQKSVNITSYIYNKTYLPSNVPIY